MTMDLLGNVIVNVNVNVNDERTRAISARVRLTLALTACLYVYMRTLRLDCCRLLICMNTARTRAL